MDDEPSFAELTATQPEGERELVDQIVDSTPVAIVVHDDTGDVVVANRLARTRLGTLSDSLHVRAYDASERALSGPEGAEVPAESLPVARVTTTGTSLQGERYGVAVDGDRGEVVWNAEPLLDEDGRVHRVVVAFATGDEIEDFAR